MFKFFQKQKKTVAVLFALGLLAAVAVEPVQAYSANCERFRTCSGPADCTWWAAHCAASDPVQFSEIIDAWW